MMILMAREAERKSKLAKEKGPNKVATIDLSDKWINWIIVALIAFLVFLNIAAYNASITGFKNLSLFWVGLILFVFAAFFHVYRYAMGKSKDTPIAPPTVPQERPKAIEESTKEPETPELPDAKPGDAGGKEAEKEIAAETPTPKVQADLSMNQNKDPNIGGTSDIPKP